MSDIIRLLPDSVANQIAAGEVIQRPAAVIKELVENAIDAGADNIQIIIKDAGRTLIQVVDNGCGMSPTDARLAFERHATSKISDAADLFDLHTMGFRGEALASICAIARVELRTMRKDDPVGTCIIIEGSKVVGQTSEMCACGSNFMVKNLFYNVPARRKFLKKDAVEMSHILREFERMALVNPEVEFKLYHNDVVQQHLLSGTMKKRIVDLFGKRIDKELVPIATSTSLVTINGFVSAPKYARRRGMLQFFTVNGRNMRHPHFHKAVMACFEQLIAPDMQPCYFIDFQVDPTTIDVNIHPTKSEIKFENEQPIWQILMAAIKEGLGKYNAVPAIDFDLDDAPEIPIFNPDAEARHGLDLDESYNPFSAHAGTTTSSSSFSGASTSFGQEREQPYRDFERKRDDGFSQVKASLLNNINIDEIEEFKVPDEAAKFDFGDASAPKDTDSKAIQLAGRYIVTTSPRGITLIDQHRAHVRILYDRFIDLAHLQAISSQRLIFPEVVELSPSQSVMLEEMASELDTLGFDLAPLGGGSWSVNGLPSNIGDVNPSELIRSIVDSASESTDEIADGLRGRIALSMARSAAIKIGQKLTDAEMSHIISDLFKLVIPGFTPDGKTVMSVVSLDEVARLFG